MLTLIPIISLIVSNPKGKPMPVTPAGNEANRKAILGRVRKALSIKTDPHVRHGSQKETELGALPVLAGSNERFLPPVGDDLEQQIELFTELSEKLKTDFRVVASREKATEQVSLLAAKNGWNRIAAHGHELIDPVVDALKLETLLTDTPYDVNELERCDVGISACEALIAQTASVLITARSSGGRALSVLPPHHVVIADSAQMLPTMAAGYRMLQAKYADDLPSFISFITGPSRTADVERVLVLGAHGPKRLTVILIR